MARKPSNSQRRGYHDRRVATRDLRQRFLILCEGSKTEPAYFKAFKVPKDVVDVEVYGLACDPLTLVTEAIRYEKEATRDGLPHDQIWCVFDRDDWSLECFNQALALARDKGIRIAYSNEAFELWYLLHFDYHDTGISRATYKVRLTSKLGFEYRKNRPDMYAKLLANQQTAIRNAEKLLAAYDPADPANDNPSTTVHLLVKELNNHARE